MTPVELVQVLEDRGVSSRELARRLDVSPMWVSRRTAGIVRLDDAEEARILAALERATDYGPPSGQ